MPFSTKIGIWRDVTAPSLKEQAGKIMTFHGYSNLRAATRDDARTLTKLIDIAGEGIPNWLWSRMATEGQTPLEVGEDRARRDTGGFSWTNAIVAEHEGAAAAMMLGYGIAEPSEEDRADVEGLPEPIRPFVELEHLSAGTFYVNALATFPGRRELGLGTALMAAAEYKAATAAIRRMSIQVFEQNTGAMKLYQRLGYRTVDTRPVLLHPCQPYYDGRVALMMKEL